MGSPAISFGWNSERAFWESGRSYFVGSPVFSFAWIYKRAFWGSKSSYFVSIISSRQTPLFSDLRSISPCQHYDSRAENLCVSWSRWLRLFTAQRLPDGGSSTRLVYLGNNPRTPLLEATGIGKEEGQLDAARLDSRTSASASSRRYRE